jgi:hypothetical protein
MRKEIYNRFNEKEKTEQLVTSEEPKLSWWIMSYYTSIGYDTGIYNTARGISQDIPLCPRNR